MRALIAAGLVTLVGAAGCKGDLKCRGGTALVTASFDSATRNADSLQVTLVYNGKHDGVVTVPGPGGKSSGTIEVDFPSGYAAGKSLHVDVTALQGGRTVGGGSADTTLLAGCSAITIAVTGSGGGPRDMSAGDAAGDLAMPPPDMLTLPVPVVSAKPDLVGFVTTLDGSKSTDPLGQSLTYAWAVQSAPAGSTITTASLASATNAKTSFEPDRGGVYMIALSVTTSDQRSATLVAAVTVPTLPIFYARTTDTAKTWTLGVRAINSDGSGDHDIGCPYSADGGSAQSDLYTQYFGYSYQPPTAAGTPLFVFESLTKIGPNTPPGLAVGSASTSCSNPPTIINNDITANHIAVSPRFSPDGTRVVFVDMPTNTSGTNGGTYRLVTVAVDGVGPKHVVRSNTGNMTYLGFTPAIWLDNNTVAWLENDASGSQPFTIFKAPDANAAGDPASGLRTPLLRCDQSKSATDLYAINQFAITPFGMVVTGDIAFRDTVFGSPPYPAWQLYKLGAPAGVNSCSTMNATSLAMEPKGGLSWDFDVSPDGLNLLFSSTHGQNIPDSGAPEPQTDIFVVPSDASSAPRKIGGDLLYDDISPRWIAGGRQFMWTRAGRGTDMARMIPAVMVANADGTHVRALQSTAAPGETVMRTDVGSSRGFDCSWTPGATGSSGGALLAVALLLVVALRRRRQ